MLKNRVEVLVAQVRMI